MNEDARQESAVHDLLCARQECFKAFRERVQALGHDLDAPAYALSWNALAGYVFDFLCENSVHPERIEQSQLENILDNLTDGLGDQNWQWEMTVSALLEEELPNLPVEEGFPDQTEDAHLEALYEDRCGYPEEVYEDIYGGYGGE